MQEQTQKQSSGKSLIFWLIVVAVIIIAGVSLWYFLFVPEIEIPSGVTPVVETLPISDITEQLTEGTTIEEIGQDLETIETEADKLLQDLEAELERIQRELNQL